MQKKVISPNDFASTTQLAATLLAFTSRYNQTARPFNWKFTAPTWTGSFGGSAPAKNQPTCHRPPDHPDELTEPPTSSPKIHDRESSQVGQPVGSELHESARAL